MKKENTFLLDDEEVMLLDDEDDSLATEEIKAPSFFMKKAPPSESETKAAKPVEKSKGIDVISVVWPEEKHGRQYIYDPNGETVEEGDIVLVPSYDKERDIEIIREATVAEENHQIDPTTLRRKPKKIISVVARKKDTVPPEQPEEHPEANDSEAPAEEIKDTKNSETGFLSHLKKWLGLA